MKRNKFYQVIDKFSDDGYVNIVIAPTAREAKKIGAYVNATLDLECWTDLEVKAIKGGEMFYTENEDNTTTYFTVDGLGYFLYTDEDSQLDECWELFLKTLKEEDRYLEEEDEE